MHDVTTNDNMHFAVRKQKPTIQAYVLCLLHQARQSISCEVRCQACVVCCDCSAVELAELQCAPLAVATIREQHRLSALHSLLFSVGESARVHCTFRSCTFLLACGPQVRTGARAKKTCEQLQATAHAYECAMLVLAHVHVCGCVSRRS